MLKLERLRFINIGAPDCRMHDLSISTVDERGEPVDTVLWLRNGGGKTAILGLFFAHLLPDAREFLKGKKDNAKFTDHVLEGDTSFILASWAGEPVALSLLETARPRLVTGRVVERRAGFTGATLPGFMFTFRPVPGVLDIDTLPWQVGGRRLSLSAFEAEMHRLGREHPEIEFTLTDRHSQWAVRLRDVGLDPQVFRYQRQMNAGEAEAAAAFMQFRTSDDFVDFLLGVVTPVEQLESLEEQIRKFAEKLRRLPAWRREQELVERALPVLRRHAEHLGLRERLELERAEAAEAATRLGRQLAAGAREAADLAQRGKADIARLDEAGERIRIRREDLQARTREVEFRAACFSEAAAERELAAAEQVKRDAQRDLEAWRLTEPLGRQEQLLARREELTHLLEVNRLDAAPILKELREAGAALRAALRAAAGEVRAAAQADEREAEAQGSLAEATRHEAERLRSEAAEIRRAVASARTALAALAAMRAELDAEGGIQPGEAAEAAVDRWCAEGERAQGHLAEVEAAIAALAQEAATLHARQLTWSAQVAARGREIAELTGRRAGLERQRRALWANEAIRGAVEVAEPDLWQEGAAIDRALRLRWLEVIDGQIAAGIRTAEDRRTSAAVDARGTLPPSLDTEQALTILAEAGIAAAYPGWDYLRHAPEPGAAERLWLQAPELAGGIVLNDSTQLDAARATLQRAGFQPVTVMAVGLAEAFDGPGVRRSGFLVPPHPGLYDPAAAAGERVAADLRLDQAEEHRAALQAAAESVAAARDALANFLRTYPEGEPARLNAAIAACEAEAEALEARQAAAEERLAGIAGEQAALADRRDALNRLRGRLPGLLARLRDLAAREHEEPAWRDLVTEGPARASAGEAAAGEELVRARAQAGARDRLLLAAQRQRDEAQHLERDADGLPEVPFPAVLRGLSLQALADRHRTLQRAYDQRLGSDVIGAEMEQVADQLRAVEAVLRKAPEDVRLAAGAFLNAPGGQTEEMRTLALSTAQQASYDAVAVAALADRAVAERRQARARAEHLRSQPPREDVEVPSPEVAAELLGRLGEEDRAAASEANSISAQYGVVGPRMTAAQHRERRLRSALALVGTVWDDGVPAAAAEGAPFAGTEDEADQAAAAVTDDHKRLGRQLDAARAQAGESGADLRALAEDCREKMPVIALRLTEPGASAEAVVDLAGEMERRLPGLRADIESAEADRSMVLIGLTQAARDGFRDLRRLQEASRLPDGLDAWSGEPFVKIAVDPPRGADGWDARLGGVLQTWVDREEIPAHSGLAILQQAVRAANGRGAAADSGDEPAVRSTFRVTLLKPDAVLTTQRYAVEAMKFSEGQDLTTAILLYCTFINLRVSRGGEPGGAAGALLLDNPIGKASLDRLIELQRRVAEIMKVQIIATTGVKDREAISHYPKIVGLRPVRTRDARMKYLQPSEDPMNLGSLGAAELIVKPAR